jgi:pterin-4a-carbinolamine dehydratase
MDHHWTLRQRPARLERRYEFADYPATREFLDRAADLSEREGLYPDISFGRTYVNATLHPEEGADELAPQHHRFAAAMDRLAPQPDWPEAA